MSFTDVFVTPYFTGTIGLSGGVSGKAVTLGDRWYLLDLKSDRFRYVSVPAMRPQADTSQQVGEGTLTRDGLWRRVVSSWHHGAGQHWFDRNDGDPNRFRTSRGVDPWEQWELSVLPDVTEIETNATGWNSLTVGQFSGGQRLVATGGNAKCMTVTPALVETNVAAGLAGEVRAASTGSTVYVSDDTGIHSIDAAGTGITLFNTNVNAADCIGFAKNRLFAGVGAALWDVIDGTTAAPHYTNPWAGWVWTGFAEGAATIYACGYSGDRGLIFSVPFLSDATGLDEPRVVAELPHGELPLAMVGYTGFLIIGTTKGVRMAQQDGINGLTLGAVVGGDEHTTHLHEVRCLEPQDRFVWFGWDDTFPDAAGLGRIDLTRFVQPLAPAYATDLMAPQAGETSAVTTFDDKRWFCTGTGLYVESATAVGEAYVESGVITYNISDDKVAVWADLRHNPLAATETIEIHGRTLSGDYDLIGTSNENTTTRPQNLFPMNHARAVGHEVKAVLKRGSSAAGPVLTGITLASQPSPERSFNVILPLLIHSSITLDEGSYLFDVPAEVAYLRRLVETQQLVRFSSGLVTHLVFVEDYEWIPHHSTQDERSYDGTVVVKLKSAELVL
jgi:hypothetical protein